MNAAVDPIRESVTAFWLQDFTIRQIAKLTGISRHMVAKHAKEWGLPPRSLANRLRTRVPLKPLKKLVDAPSPIGPIGDFPAGNACHYIAGEPDKSFQCCGHPGYPYCEYHARVCHEPARASIKDMMKGCR